MASRCRFAPVHCGQASGAASAATVISLQNRNGVRPVSVAGANRLLGIIRGGPPGFVGCVGRAGAGLAWVAPWLVQQAHVAAAGGWRWSGGVFADLLVFDFQDVHDAGEAFDGVGELVVGLAELGHGAAESLVLLAQLDQGCGLVVMGPD